MDFCWEDIKKFWDTFNALDKDSSGSVTLDEFLALPDFSGLSRKEVSTLFEMTDQDGSGQISFLEFLSFVSRLRRLNPSAFPSVKSTSRSLSMNEITDAFKVFSIMDTSNDLNIQASEFYQAYHSLDPSITRDFTDRLLKMLDTDANGNISFDEFIRGIALGQIGFGTDESQPAQAQVQTTPAPAVPPIVATAPAPAATLSPAPPGASGTSSDPAGLTARPAPRRLTEKQKAQALKAFSTADVDDSGTMSLSEFYLVLRMLDPRMTRLDAQRFFKLIDKDSSGDITIEEFLKGAELFQWDFTGKSPRTPRADLMAAPAPPTPSPTSAARTDTIIEIPFSELQLVKKLGEGSFGIVHKGKWRGSDVAVKQLRFEGGTIPSAIVADFRVELAILTKMRHPHIVLLMGAVLTPPHLCFVTEFLDGGSLFDVLHSKNLRVDAPLFFQLAKEIAQGMNYIHLSHVVHRDLKTPNILLDSAMHVKICDFGLSKTRTARETMSEQVGSPIWMAPELMRGDSYSEKVDVYAYGIILWEILTGKIPFENLSETRLVVAVASRGLRPMIPPATAGPLRDLIQACWHQDPAKRPSFAEVLTRLETIPHRLC